MSKLLVITIIFVTAAIFGTKATCPEGGKVTPDGKCLWSISVILSPLSHVQAATNCREGGGQLPTIKTPEKESMLRELANTQRETVTPVTNVGDRASYFERYQRNDAIYVWINLQRDPLPPGANVSDMTVWQQRESWKWKDDESSVSEEMWRFWNKRGNEPNNFQQTSEYCVVATVKADGESTWNDATCSDHRWYDGATSYPSVVICEKDN